jgi:hypothetical protein
MKKSFAVIALAGALAALWCSSLFAQWSPDLRLTYTNFASSNGLNNAWCVAANGNMIHIVWVSKYTSPALDWEICYMQSINGGLDWSPMSYLTANDGITSWEPSVAVSGNDVHVVWQDYRDGSSTPAIFYKVSHDGGSTWGSDTRLTKVPPPFSNANFPSVSALGLNVHAVWMDGNQIYYNRSTDGGDHWLGVTTLTYASSSKNCPSVAACGSKVHVAWTDSRNGSAIYYKRSTDWGVTWIPNDEQLISTDPPPASYSSIAASGTDVHIAWTADNAQIYYARSLDEGVNWSGQSCLVVPFSQLPSIAVMGSIVHVAWQDRRNGQSEVFYKFNTNRGDPNCWGPDTRLTYTRVSSVSPPSIAVADPNKVHIVWTDLRDNYPNPEMYYKTNEFRKLLTDSSNGRHLIRDPSSGNLHLVMRTAGDSVYYSQSSDGGGSWSSPYLLGSGRYPTVGVAMTGPGYAAICVAYKRTVAGGGYKLSYRWCDPLGVWHAPVDISTSTNPGPPSLVISGTWVYVAYKSGAAVLCSRFECTAPAGYVTEAIDATGGPSLPCLAVDGNGAVYGAWRRSTTNAIWYAPRGSSSPYWSSKLQVDVPGAPSQQPFVECYGESAFVVWSEGTSPSSEALRRAKRFSDNVWLLLPVNVSNSSTYPSESPTQAGQRLTTWAEGTGGGMFDTYYYRADWGTRAPVVANPTEWSYWVHSQMTYNDLIGQTYLWTAWTESPNPGASPFRVLTNFTSMPSFFGPGDADFGPYYRVLAGQDTASVYCLKRDGVLRFADKAVDFARDSLVYELPYLDPVYDYYLKVYSYRETGENWAQGLSVDGSLNRTIQFASNRVDTIRVRIPPELYVEDRKIRFVLKNLRGDYVPALGITLFQRDPKPRGMNGGGQGGGQAGVPVSMPYREVFAVYPNPVKGQAQIEYSLMAPGEVDLAVYDVTGRLVRRVVEGVVQVGVHRVSWDGKDRDGRKVSSGIYFVKLSSPDQSKMARLIVVR